jgi:hypothetical protein
MCSEVVDGIGHATTTRSGAKRSTVQYAWTVFVSARVDGELPQPTKLSLTLLDAALCNSSGKQIVPFGKRKL